MEITLTIPDGLVADLQNGHSVSISRLMLELAAIKAYESELITERQVMEMLGFTSRTEELYPFLKAHAVRRNYALEDLERDRATFAALPGARIAPFDKPPEQRPLGIDRGLFCVPDDFNAPLPEDLLRAFEGQG